MTSVAGYKCGEHTCGVEVKEGIQCDRCLLWYHNNCSRLDQDSIDLYARHSQLKWICFHCVCLADIGSRLIHDRTFDSVTHVSDVHESASRNCVHRLDSAEKLIRDQSLLIETLRSKVEELQSSLECYLRSAELAMGRQRNVLIYNREEPVIRETRTRRDLDRRRVHDILRIAGIPLYVGIKRVHRVGSWRETSMLRHQGYARPILVEFRNPIHRDLLLNRAGLVASQTNGRYQIAPDTLTSKAKASRLSRLEDTSTSLANESAVSHVGIHDSEPHVMQTPKKNSSVCSPVARAVSLSGQPPSQNASEITPGLHLVVEKLALDGNVNHTSMAEEGSEGVVMGLQPVRSKTIEASCSTVVSPKSMGGMPFSQNDRINEKLATPKLDRTDNPKCTAVRLTQVNGRKPIGSLSSKPRRAKPGKGLSRNALQQPSVDSSTQAADRNEMVQKNGLSPRALRPRGNNRVRRD
ncbi:unnamed protein product [Dicrocoelium dendriticum]|nr:unnamed protein product [Dicrocoelium dendriticum]